MPCTPEAIELFKKKQLLFAPGKASNAGGVAVSGLEMAQNSLRYSRSEEHTSELQSQSTISYAVFCLKKKILNHVRSTIRQCLDHEEPLRKTES